MDGAWANLLLFGDEILRKNILIKVENKLTSVKT